VYYYPYMQRVIVGFRLPLKTKQSVANVFSQRFYGQDASSNGGSIGTIGVAYLMTSHIGSLYVV
jgi:hypothetical protein